MKILVASPAFCQPGLQSMVDYLRERVEDVVLNPYKRTLTKDEIRLLWGDVDGIIAGVEPYSADVLADSPPALKVITRYGTGYDSVDVKVAGQRGIMVTNTPGVNAPAVADLALGLMIGIARRIPQYDAKTRQGQWTRYVGTGLTGKTLGIIGLGAIGKEVAKRALGFSMNVLAFDPYFDAEFAAANGIRKTTVEEIVRESDFVTLHVPVTPETDGMINAETLGIMKSSAFLINTARGELVDEQALYLALKERRIAGAALDVFRKEPLVESPLFELDNIVVTPHLAGHTYQAEQLMGKLSIDNTLAILNGAECPHVVNRAMLVKE